MSSEPARDRAYWADVDRHVIRYAPEFAPVIVERAQGSTLHTADGRQLLDFTSGQMSAILGHSHPAIVATLREAAGTLDHLFSGMLSRPVVELSRRLAATLPDPLEKVLLLTTGSESNEAALRLAKLVTGGHEIVAFSRSWHGMTLGAAGATYAAARRGSGPQAPGNFVLPTPYPDDDWRRSLDLGFDLIDAQSTGSLAACLVEPILSTAGIVVPPRGYLPALREKCRERGMLLIFDEAQTGLGRTGDWYAFEDEGVVPDILTLSKTLGAGLPLAAVVTTPEIEATAHERGFLFYTTHVSDPLVAAVGMTVLDVIERENLVDRAREHGRLLHDAFEVLGDRHAAVGGVRGRGMLLGLELVVDPETGASSPEFDAAVTARCLELGLHMNVAQLRDLGGIFRIAPPLTASRGELLRGVEILDQAIGEVSPHYV